MKNILNNIRKWTLAFTLTLSAGLIQAQTFEIPLRRGTLEIKEVVGNIYLEAYDGSEIIIKGKGGYRMPPEQSQGLTSLRSMYDNTRLGLHYQKTGNIITLQTVRGTNRKGYTLKVPRLVKLKINNFTNRCRKIKVSNFSSEVEITTRYAQVELNNLRGKARVYARHGVVKAQFEQINGNTSIASRHGSVDITLPEQVKADLTASTYFGEIYTNLDIPIDKLGVSNNPEINIKLNGGGRWLRLNSRHSNVYIRSK